MGLLYESVEETVTRLHNTVFLYKSQPVFCISIVQSNKIDLQLLFFPDGKKSATVPLDDPDLEYRRFNLGYINLNEGATYMSRVPARGHFKQGLCKENTQFTTIDAKYQPKFDPTFRTAGFRDMLVGKYPSLEEAVERLSVKDGAPARSVAFNQRFAIRKDEFRGDWLLDYKGHRIGFGSKEFQIPEEFRYLREIINSSGIKIR